MPQVITVKRGALYLDVALYEQWLAPVRAVVLLRDAQDLLVLPVRVGASGGGYLVKIRNVVGDRVVHAEEFLRDQGVEDAVELTGEVAWSDARGALVGRGIFARVSS